MSRASVSIHIRTRTVYMEDIPSPFTHEEEDLQNDDSHPTETVMSLDELHSDISLSEDHKDAVLRLLSKSESMFDGRLGPTAPTEHVIETGDAKPVHLPPYHTSPAKKQITEAQVQQMLNDGIIEPSRSPWAAPVVTVNRAASDLSFCVDFWGLNQETRKDSYLLPRVDESLDFLTSLCQHWT